jgi:transcriptional regulator with XRE-family HTH domain
MDLKVFGARLRELREQAGLSQQQLADKAKLSQRGIANWELGLREPMFSMAVALATALEVPLEALLEAPEHIPEPKRGRPRKADVESADQAKAQEPRKRKGEEK